MMFLVWHSAIVPDADLLLKNPVRRIYFLNEWIRHQLGKKTSTICQSDHNYCKKANLRVIAKSRVMATLKGAYLMKNN